ncbi:MAG: hypothetical protein ACFB15_21520 [Cyclobacteriaceae bacterium]
MKLKLKWWWYILPAYLTLWSTSFSLWSLLDSEGMMAIFGIDTGGSTAFILLNSASRYVAIAVGMVVGVWIFRTFYSILTALIVRLTMDILDLYSGLQAGVIESVDGIFQSAFMFLLPNLISIFLLIRLTGKE